MFLYEHIQGEFQICISVPLKLTSHGILHDLWSALLAVKNLFLIDCVNIYLLSIFFSIAFANIYVLHIFFKRICQVEKCGVTLYCLYRDSLTLNLNPVKLSQ